MKAEFAQFSNDYEDLLKDPIRDRFSPKGGGFFHVRKRDLIRDYFRKRREDTKKLAYLDVGCGRGELVSLLRDDFARAAGCDISGGMAEVGNFQAKGIEVRLQDDPAHIPFGGGEFDFVTAVVRLPPCSAVRTGGDDSRDVPRSSPRRSAGYCRAQSI